jgi:hypothetical protein
VFIGRQLRDTKDTCVRCETAKKKGRAHTGMSLKCCGGERTGIHVLSSDATVCRSRECRNPDGRADNTIENERTLKTNPWEWRARNSLLNAIRREDCFYFTSLSVYFPTVTIFQKMHQKRPLNVKNIHYTVYGVGYSARRLNKKCSMSCASRTGL